MNASCIVRHGISLHPHVLLSTPADEGDTYSSERDASLGVKERWRRSIVLEE